MRTTTTAAQPRLDIAALNWDLANGGPCTPVPGRAPRKALVAYLPGAVDSSLNPGLDFVWSNTGQIRCLVRCLNELSFAVDLVHLGAAALPPRAGYEVILAHPGPAFDAIHSSLPTAVPRIYLSTEAHRATHQHSAEERSRLCFLRRGLRIPPDRPSTGSDMNLSVSHGLLGNGSNWTRSTYPPHACAEFIANAAYADPIFLNTLDCRRLGEVRGVLYLAGPGPLHKGLDLILDAVDGTGIELHVCSWLTANFENAYAPQLRSLPNVYYHGWTAPHSPALRAIVARCSFAILASCSEGSPGSVAQALQYGLIPVLTPESGFDLDEPAIAISDASVESIRHVLTGACERPFAWISCRRKVVLDHAVRAFSPAAYRERVLTALTSVFHRLGVFSRYG